MTDNDKNNYILKTYNLTVIRNGKTLLDSVNLRIEHGSLIMLLGHNGAGNCVLLRTLHGLLLEPMAISKDHPPSGRKSFFRSQYCYAEARANISVLSVPAVPTKTLKPGLRMPIWNNRWTRTRISSRW